MFSQREHCVCCDSPDADGLANVPVVCGQNRLLWSVATCVCADCGAATTVCGAFVCDGGNGYQSIAISRRVSGLYIFVGTVVADQLD